ncbi:MAG: hypothetical protein ACOC56_04080 [Atribacterota bacterium]
MTNKRRTMYATFIIVRKKPEIITIFVREDKKVLFNFGSDIWIDFLKIKDSDTLHSNKGKNKKFRKWVDSPKFKKNYSETLKIINNYGYKMIVDKFYKDFKKDRVPIIKREVEIDPDARMGGMQ